MTLQTGGKFMFIDQYWAVFECFKIQKHTIDKIIFLEKIARPYLSDCSQKTTC